MVTRWQASGTHLALSAAIIGLVAGAVVVLWYPPELFRLGNVARLIGLIALVDVTIGPLITLIIYKAGKPGLRFDLSVIAFLQLSLLGYGLYVLSENRPIFMVAVKDRFELVTAREISDEDLARASPAFRQKSWTGARLVGVKFPEDPAELSELTFEALAGRDIHVQPRYFVDASSTFPGLLQSANAVSDLLRTANAEERDRIHQASSEAVEPDLKYVPITNSKLDTAIMLLSLRTGQPAGVVDVDPWDIESRLSVK